MSVNRTSIVWHNRRTTNQKWIQVWWTFYVSPNTNIYDVYYDYSWLSKFTIDIWDYIVAWYTNRDIAWEYLSFLYLKMSKIDWSIKLIYQNDADDIESWMVLKYYNWHLYVNYLWGVNRYLDIDFINETYSTQNGSYSWSWDSVDNDWVSYWWYTVTLYDTYYEDWWYDYHKPRLKFIW